MMTMLKFSNANSKLLKLAKTQWAKKYLEPTASHGRRKVYSLDTLSGWACPFANECMSRAVPVTVDGVDTVRVQDGPHTVFRCFSASQEVSHPNVYRLRKGNFDILRDCQTVDAMVDQILEALPDDAGIVRIHVSGDFFSPAYFRAWISVAQCHPDRHFYAYTKSLPYWIDMMGKIPANLSLTASKGGRRDDLIEQHNLKHSVVVYSFEEAERLGLEIDHDDSHAADPSKGTFALLIHGTQPKGSEAGKAVYRLRKAGADFEYSR
jgi:hypothetical protein